MTNASAATQQKVFARNNNPLQLLSQNSNPFQLLSAEPDKPINQFELPDKHPSVNPFESSVKPNVTVSTSVIQPMYRVKTGKTTTIKHKGNHQIFSDAIDALTEVQDDDVTTVGSFAHRVSLLGDYVNTKGFDKDAVQDLEVLYKEMAEISFKSNPILNEAWSRCIESTRSAAAKTKYGSVGGKFRRNFEQVLREVGTGYPALQSKIDNLITVDVNKEHMLNKGLGGAQTEHRNLMNAGVGEKHKGSTGTLSAFHKELHRMKSGGKNYNYDAMDEDFEDVVSTVQSGYESDDMGELEYD